MAQQSAPTTRTFTVRLITGDGVRVLEGADGSTSSVVLPGSSGAGDAVARWHAGADSYVLPRSSSTMRGRLDLSLFDVTALSGFGERVPVEVTFRKGSSPHRLRGLDLESDTARRTARGASVLVGSYGPGFRGLTADDLADVSLVRLAVSRPNPGRAAVTHRLDVSVVDPAGGPSSDALVNVIGLDDGSFVQDWTGDGGLTRFHVPDGSYSILAFSFERLVLAADVEVSADQSVALDLGDATVKPRVTMDGYRVVDTALSVGRSPDSGFMFPFGFSGPRFFMRVQPTSADVAHGALSTGVSATLVPRDTRAPFGRIALTADVADGIPGDLTFDHRRADFAKVVDRLYANGPAGARQSFFGVFADMPNGFLDLFSGRMFSVRIPGRRVVLFQAGPRVGYQQTVMPQSASPATRDATQLITVGRYPRPGTTRVVTFAHGPVGPGFRGETGPGVDYVTRVHGRLTAYLPLFNGAGSSMGSYVDRADGSWSLRTRGRVLARGHHDIELHARVPAGMRTYTLTATSHPRSRLWTLSTWVRDSWTFRSSRAHPSAALLTPAYVAPIAPRGGMAAGRTAFDLAFSSLTSQEHRVARASFQLSTDGGRHWRTAHLTRTSPTTFRVRYDNPSARPNARFMSIRVTARDTRGNAVTETALRVYRLR
ncbi:MAG: hypothetical protein U0R80_00070 [Nocardioidaceae bacterium]